MPPTLNNSSPPVNWSPTREELRRALIDLQEPDRADDATLSGLALVLSVAADAGDLDALEDAVVGLRRLIDVWERRDDAADEARAEQRGVLVGLLELVGWKLQRSVPDQDPEALEESMRPKLIEFLEHLRDNPGCSNTNIVQAIGVDGPRVSRHGSELVTLGLARRRKVGRDNRWDLTSKGERFLDLYGTKGGDEIEARRRVAAEAFDAALRGDVIGIASDLYELAERVSRLGPWVSAVRETVMVEEDRVHVIIRFASGFESWSEVWAARVADGTLVDVEVVSETRDPLATQEVRSNVYRLGRRLHRVKRYEQLAPVMIGGEGDAPLRRIMAMTETNEPASDPAFGRDTSEFEALAGYSIRTQSDEPAAGRTESGALDRLPALVAQ